MHVDQSRFMVRHLYIDFQIKLLTHGGSFMANSIVIYGDVKK